MIKFTDILRHPEFFISDETILKYKHRKKIGTKLDLKNPVLFSEKVQWLKLYDRNPDYPNLVDKHEVREYIARTIGEEYLIPSYAFTIPSTKFPSTNCPNSSFLNVRTIAEAFSFAGIKKRST
jgi:hypothetical protein